MHTNKIMILLSCILLCIFTNSIVFAETCTSGSGTSCSMTCSEGTLTLVCNKSEKNCSGSCSKAHNKENAAYNLIADIYYASGETIPINLILEQLKESPMDIKGAHYDLDFEPILSLRVIIKTDFRDFSRTEWDETVKRAAERIRW